MSKGFEMVIIGILCMSIGVWIFRTMYIHIISRLQNNIKMKDGTIICSLITLILMGIQIMLGLCLFGLGIDNLIH